MDQAATLRNLMQSRTARNPVRSAAHVPKVVTVTGDARLAPDLADAFARYGTRASVDPHELDADIIFVNCGDLADYLGESALSLYSPNFVTVLAMDAEPASLTRTFGLVRSLRARAGISRASIVVNQVTDGAAGRRAFQKLKDVADRSLDIELEYLGHRDVINRGFLLDLKDGGSSQRIADPSLELVAKRLRMKCLDWAR